VARAVRPGLVAALVIAAFTSSGAQTAPAPLTVTSPAFSNGDTLTRDFTADGRNVSPPLEWTGAPATTKEYALVLDDSDANFGGRGPFVHWVLYKIPGTAKGLPEGVPMGATVTTAGIAGAINGLSGFNAFQRPGSPPSEPGYRGPAPPPGAPHHYRFSVYALNAPLDAGPGLDKAALLKAMEGKVVAQGEIVGVYQK
jgi:Raf kinase inhibitor-like YbhB/YbcL family protein